MLLHPYGEVLLCWCWALHMHSLSFTYPYRLAQIMQSVPKSQTLNRPSNLILQYSALGSSMTSPSDYPASCYVSVMPRSLTHLRAGRPVHHWGVIHHGVTCSILSGLVPWFLLFLLR